MKADFFLTFEDKNSDNLTKITSDFRLEELIHKSDESKEKLNLIGTTENLYEKIQIEEIKTHLMSYNLVENLKNAEKIDLAFLLDITACMEQQIEKLITNLEEIIIKLQDKFIDFSFRLGFVGYRDYKNNDGFEEVEPLNICDFLEDANTFKFLLENIEIRDGEDQCENVFGGLDSIANKLEWKNPTRILIHIADAPCHGRRFYEKANDSYTDGDPTGLKIDEIVRVLIEKQIDYHFFQINSSTQKMIQEFNKELAKLGGNDIEISLLKNSEDNMKELVINSVTKAIKNRKFSDAQKRQPNYLSNRLKRLNKLKTNSEIDLRPIQEHFYFENMRKLEGTYITAEFDGKIEDIVTKENIEWKELRDFELWISIKPFEKGRARLAYAGYLKKPYSSEKIKVVIKESIYEGDAYNSFKFYSDYMENQVISKVLFKEFLSNFKEEIENNQVKFIDINLFRINISNKDFYFTVEDYIDKPFRRWSSNDGFMKSALLDCFSHWTYHKTNTYLIIYDLDGYLIENTADNTVNYLLSDSAIICQSDRSRFTLTNINLVGILDFFRKHECNKICTNLKLKKHTFQRRNFS